MFFCDDCGESFKHKTSYRRHLKRFPNPHSFSCIQCEKKFKRLDFLNKHYCQSKTADPSTWIATVKYLSSNNFDLVDGKEEGEKNGESLESDEDDVPLSKLFRLQPESVNTENRQCPSCLWIFTTSASLKRHLKTYTDSHFLYPCCGKPLKRTDNILKHDCTSEAKDPIYQVTNSLQDESENYPPSPTDFTYSVYEDEAIGSDSEDEKGTFSCQNCPRTFHSPAGLAKHLKRYPNKHDFKCLKCQRNFLKEKQLSEHMCILEGRDVFQCSCQQPFTTLKKFKKHIGNKRPYFCCLCKRQCKTVNNLINHIRTHTSDKPYKCQYCTKSFALKDTMKLHIRTHTKERPFQCSKCSYSCAVKYNLHLHEASHNNNKLSRNKSFLCTVCGAAFGRKHHFSRHVLTHSAEKPCLCKVCGKLFKDGAYLNKHLQIHNRKSDLGIRCVKCGEEFSKKEAFKHHMKTNHFDHVCTACSKVFVSKYNLMKHLTLHNDPDSILCRSMKGNLNLYECEICGNKFQLISTLKRHIETHQQVSCTCTLCHNVFNSVVELENHYQLHHFINKPQS